ncbi:MAG TPA: Uma2 family endonuclease, partial [Oscillatoriaceae cyanobacterium M33_DOE_052]|nr:Uma2 family endonuclease [Oscillatoriaceae cyanobacterium M33_DOE_052]
FDDGEPLESNRHRIGMNVLIRSLQQAWSQRNDFFTGGNMFVYYSSDQAMNRDFRGPDFFAVLDVDGTKERQGWVVWLEAGRYPDVIVELMSPSTARIDKGKKKDLYQQTFRTPDYFVFDPFEPNSLQGWHLDISLGYQPLVPNEQGWLWCETLGFWLGTWPGTIDREAAVWLRFYDTEGNLVLLPEEAERQKAQQAEQLVEAERQKAEAERQKAQQAEQLVEAERQKAQQAEQLVEAERQKAEAERQKAQQAEQLVEAERQKAEAERQRAERLAERLRDLGLDPDNL